MALGLLARPELIRYTGNMTLERLCPAAAALLHRDSRVAAAYLFGSAARGREAAEDVDVALLLKPSAARRAHQAVFAAQAGLEDLLGRPVDVVALNDADPFLRLQVYAKGRAAGARARAHPEPPAPDGGRPGGAPVLRHACDSASFGMPLVYAGSPPASMGPM